MFANLALTLTLLSALYGATSATPAPAPAPSTFRVNSTGSYLDRYGSLAGPGYAVLNYPQSDSFIGSPVYLRNGRLYFQIGECASGGVPVIVPGPGRDWLLGDTGTAGSKGFYVAGGVDTGLMLGWKGGIVYGCPNSGIGYYATTTLAYALSQDQIPSGCAEVPLNVFDDEAASC